MTTKSLYRRTVSPVAGKGKRRPRLLMPPIILAVIAFALSLGGLVRVSAMPAEARIQETWFAYSHELRLDYSARVRKGSVYASDTIGPDALLRTKAPGEPPVYRRVLVSQLTDRISISMPYVFKTDRPAEIKASYRVDGTMTVPGLWQKPYPMLSQKEITVTGTELSITDMTVEIPVKQLVGDIQKWIDEMRLSHDQLEIKLRPVVQVTVNGQREPINAGFAPEFTVLLRNPATVEVDEPKALTDSKSFVTTTVTSRTLSFFGRQFSLVLIRQVALIGLSLIAAALVVMMALQWLQRRAAGSGGLKRLGSSLVNASHFTVPPDAALVDVPDAQQLISLHLRTDRPVIQTREACYLVDGNTCYRLLLRAQHAADD